MEPVVIRFATPADRAALERLAELECVGPPTGATLIAELGQRMVAALSLADGRVLGDPFIRTAELVELLRLRAQQLTPRLAPRASFATLRSTRTPLVRSLRLLLR